MKFIKENIRLVIAVVIALILIITGVILLNINKEDEEGSPVNPPIQEESEEKLEEVTGFSKEDAIEVVKESFESDNYEYQATATNDGLYKVVVTNTVTDTEIVYYVDPTNGNAYIDLETK